MSFNSLNQRSKLDFEEAYFRGFIPSKIGFD
jgi:hypothetical protein